jgi:hypothetical protein
MSVACVYLVQPLDDLFIVLGVALYHAGDWVGKPLLELSVGLEDGGHEEVHQRPQLHQVVLQRSARQQQPPAITITAVITIPTGGKILVL